LLIGYFKQPLVNITILRSFFRNEGMARFQSGFIEHNINIFDYLRSVQLLRSNLDVQVWDNKATSGMLSVRNGTVVSASCGRLTGNGALLTLGRLRRASLYAVTAGGRVAPNVNLSGIQLETLLKNPELPLLEAHSREGRRNVGRDDGRSLEEMLAHALDFIYQVERQKAADLLIQILRKNRFFYPAWLWYSRLLNRRESICKALEEAVCWGNDDQEITLEGVGVEIRLRSLPDSVKRCFFCWAPVASDTLRCCNCGGLRQTDTDGVASGEVLKALAVQKSLARYEAQLVRNPLNVKILYVLSLGYLSLGELENCRSCINKGLRLMPDEKLLRQVARLL